MGIKIDTKDRHGQGWASFQATSLDAKYSAREDVWAVVFEGFESLEVGSACCSFDVVVDVYSIGEYVTILQAKGQPITPKAILWGQNRETATRTFATGRWWNDTGKLSSVNLLSGAPVVLFPSS